MRRASSVLPMIRNAPILMATFCRMGNAHRDHLNDEPEDGGEAVWRGQGLSVGLLCSSANPPLPDAIRQRTDYRDCGLCGRKCANPSPGRSVRTTSSHHATAIRIANWLGLQLRRVQPPPPSVTPKRE